MFLIGYYSSASKGVIITGGDCFGDSYGVFYLGSAKFSGAFCFYYAGDSILFECTLRLVVY